MFSPLLVIIGFTVGITVGISGIGGAALTAPLLIFLGIPPVNVVGTDIIFNATTKSVGSILIIKRKSIDFLQLKYLILGSIPAIVFGSIFIKHLQELMEWTRLNEFFLIFIGLVLIGVPTFYLTSIRSGSLEIYRGKNSPRISVLIGSIIGFLLLFTSIGAGTLVSLYLMKILNASKKIVGTSILYGLVISALASALYFNLGTIQFNMLISMLIGSIPGIYAGVKLNDYVPLKPLRLIISILILFSGILILIKVFI